jgi:hypothetical protein
MKTFLSSTLVQKIIFVISIALILFLSAISFKNINKVSESTKKVNHTYEVSITLEKLFMSLKDLETAKRNYILTRNDTLKKQIFTEKIKINQLSKQLSFMLKDNKLQMRNLNDLEALINVKYTLVENAFHLKPLDYNDFNTVKEYLLKGSPIMEKIKNKITEMTEIEARIFNKRSRDYDEISQNSPVIIFITLLITIFLLGSSLLMLLRTLNETKKYNVKLVMAKESANMAESIGKYGTLLYNINTDKFEFSDNEFRLLGYEPNGFNSDIESYIRNIHPDDRDYISRITAQIKYAQSLGPVSFRIIRKDGKIIYMKATSKMVQNLLGEKIVIGVTTDVTQEYLGNLNLAQKNRELEESNKELQAFNYIASHDLQEPLRKIETFISRLEQKDYQNFTDTGKQYFDRIKVSASRMRLLIQDLLHFSRTNKTEKVFEYTNINKLLENAKNEIAESIEENKVTIEAAKLPTIKVISFQVQQLFINLIENSIKYAKENVQPIIKIDYQLAYETEIAGQKFPNKRKFHKIIYSDNGIGFSQEYSQKIFELFSRLHDKDTIAGTGIGLAICKKIIDNHQGFILAEGKLGKGAIFTMYFPID